MIRFVKKKKKNPGCPTCTYLNYNLWSVSTHKDGCLLSDLQAKQSEAVTRVPISPSDRAKMSSDLIGIFY